MNEDETWKAVGSVGLYEVSNLGRVRTTAGKIKLPTLTSQGALVVNLYGHGHTCVRAVHTLVAEAFLGPRPPSHMVGHLDGNPLKCHAKNLTYIPLSLRKGLGGSGPPSTKLSRQDALKIRLRARSGESTLALAKEFGVSSAHVSNIKLGTRWPE